MNSAADNLFLKIFIILILVMINAFFAAAEMAIVSLNKNKVNMLAEEGEEKAVLLKKLTEEPSKFLATIQVGITLAGFFASASAATSISLRFAAFLRKFNTPYSSQISIIVVTIILSYITLVFGELIPKRIALQKSQDIAMFAVKPIVFISKITSPFVRLLSSSTNLLVRLLGFSTDNLEEKVSIEEIKSLIDVGEEHGVINSTEREMINGIFTFDDKLAKEIMTPRTEVFSINLNAPMQESIQKIVEEKYSRVPVYEEDTDNIIGILYTKDLFAYINKNEEISEEYIKSILRDAYFVPETKNIDQLFKELQSTKNHMAILIDEYGGFSGIVTMEDLIEEVMGNILDEYDDREPAIKKIDTNTYLVDGLLSIDEVNEYLDLHLKSNNSDTIGGFVIDLLGYIPTDKEERTVEFENIVFKVEKVDEKRIEILNMYINT
ncbi:hemolysin family protein [Haloimpatiens lingqiaonensis]|uniref:hemolysin family protein n=1 Tax=Haloimpatiens lingqiaonensis TaxID=1380675 RepID=UPI0010FE4F58|nr:hemolysin family protein [Haloimpatiens lingqiaonensis]